MPMREQPRDNYGRFVAATDTAPDLECCFICEESFDPENGMTFDNGRRVCPDCFENYSTCENCGEYRHNDDFVPELSRCDGCVRELARQAQVHRCNDCCEFFWLDEEEFFLPAGCGDPALAANPISLEEALCSNCAPRDSNPIPSWRFMQQTIQPRRRGRFTPSFLPIVTYPSDKSLIKSRILVKLPYGFEMETVNGGNYNLNIQSVCGFGAVTDASIRRDYPDDIPMEFRSPVFLDDTSFAVVEKFCRYKDRGLRVNDSCGFHLHLDGRQWDWQDVRKMLCLAKTFEDDFMRLVDPSRHRNSYCSAIDGDCDDWCDANSKEDFLCRLMRTPKHTLESCKRAAAPILFEGHSTNPSYCGEWEKSRYEWMNVVSWFTRRTVEIRLHHATLDFQEVRNWILLWQAITHWAQNHPVDLIEELSSPGDILPDNLQSYYQERRN